MRAANAAQQRKLQRCERKPHHSPGILAARGSVLLTVVVDRLTYTFPNASTPVLRDVSFRLAARERCLLLGRNGAGKSTLLQILAGRRMIPPSAVQILGRPAFHDTDLVRDVGFIGGSFPFDTDIEVHEILAKLKNDKVRQARLIEALGVDPHWHMHRVSDGQRRRVQMLLALLDPRSVLLLDEVTSDLDVLARLDLLAFLQQEEATVLYATHVFDRLESWATHVLWLEDGKVALHLPIEEALAGRLLIEVVEGWLRRR